MEANFLRPTKDKILATILIIMAVWVANSATNILIEFIPGQAEIADSFVDQSMSEYFENFDKHIDEWIYVGTKIFAVMVIVYSITIYLAVCIIYTHLRNRKLWVIIGTLVLLSLLA